MTTARSNDNTQSGTRGGGGLMGLFRRMSRKAAPSASVPLPPIAPTSSPTLQRRATVGAVASPRRTFSMRRKHRHGTLADMARSQSNEEPSVEAVALNSSSTASPSPPPPHARRRQDAPRAVSDKIPRSQAVVPVWGPPPALRSSTSSGSVSSQHDALLQGGGSSTAWNGMTLAEERAARRRSMRSPTWPRETNQFLSPSLSAGGGLGRSSSISSTTRARATGRPLSTVEMNKRSSQFIGQWSLSPSISEQALLPTEPIDTRRRSLSSPTSLLPPPPTYWASVFDDAQRVHFDSTPLPADGTHDSLLAVERVEEQSNDDDDFGSAFDLEQLDGFASDGSPSRVRDTGSPVTDCPSSPSSSPTVATTPIGSVWAISRGWRTGVYATYEEAHDQLRGFPGPVARQFDTVTAAQDWLRDDAMHAQRVPSIRTLAIDEELADARKASATTQHRPLSAAIVDPDVLQSIVQSSVNLRRIASPPPPASATFT